MMDRQAREALRTALRISRSLTGFDPREVVSRLRGVTRFVATARTYSADASRSRFPLNVRHLYPVLGDFFRQAGSASGHYFHQDLWAARKVFARRPSVHVDVGSRVDGFVAHLLVFMPVRVVDVRPLESSVDGLQFVQSDASDMLGFDDNSIESLSSLHAIEHFGLGRYGDPVDPDACFRAMSSLARVLRPGGHLYFSVPIGRERLEFNAHRIFAPDTVLSAFRGLRLSSFSAIDDAGDLRQGGEPHDFADSDVACGLFEFEK